MTTRITAAQADALRASGAALVDIRSADEFARRHVPGSINRPLAELTPAQPLAGTVVFLCLSGMRTGANAALLADCVTGQALILEGGLQAWAKAGLPVVTDRRAPLDIMRQVQIVAGTLILLGVGLGALVAPGFYALAGFVGAGLLTAGVTGFCGMARLLTWIKSPRALPPSMKETTP